MNEKTSSNDQPVEIEAPSSTASTRQAEQRAALIARKKARKKAATKKMTGSAEPSPAAAEEKPTASKKLATKAGKKTAIKAAKKKVLKKKASPETASAEPVDPTTEPKTAGAPAPARETTKTKTKTKTKKTKTTAAGSGKKRASTKKVVTKQTAQTKRGATGVEPLTRLIDAMEDFRLATQDYAYRELEAQRQALLDFQKTTRDTMKELENAALRVLRKLSS